MAATPTPTPTMSADAAAPAPADVSMWRSPRVIQEGSLVILFENHSSVTYCYAARGEIFQNRHGAFYHDDMIGRPFGSKIVSRKRNARGYMILLAPTPELWSRALRHRTQIVFTLDASAIALAAALRSGSRVVESGTGSGALTTSLARAVAPAGRVFTFEFNATRAQAARDEFQRNGLADVVAVACRDACAQGFPAELAGSIDLVFLDLPSPWKAVGHAARALRQGGAFASYSPCIEQVQKTCDALREANFELIRTIETRLVPYSARNIDLPVPDFGLAKPAEAAAEDRDEGEQPDAATETEGDAGKPAGAPVVGRKRKFKGKSVGEHVVAKKDDEIRGHTAYLTFATKFSA